MSRRLKLLANDLDIENSTELFLDIIYQHLKLM